MKLLICQALVVTLLGCATVHSKFGSSGDIVWPDTSSVMSLVGGGHWGQACPIEVDGTRAIFSARHLLSKTTSEGVDIMLSFIWEDGQGREGWGSAHYLDPFQDLGLLAISDRGDDPDYRPVSDRRPQPGDHVFWREFNPELEKGLQQIERKSKVLDVRLGHILIEDAPDFGASGSCLFNSLGEVVGIVVWRQVDGTEEVGGAILLTLEKIDERTESSDEIS